MLQRERQSAARSHDGWMFCARGGSFLQPVGERLLRSKSRLGGCARAFAAPYPRRGSLRIGVAMSSKFLSMALFAALGAASYGCQGNVDGGVEGQPSPPGGAAGSGSQAATPEQVLASAACQKPAPGAAPLRRLSNAE